MNAESILLLFDGVKKLGPDRWCAKSPLRDERTASLYFRDTGDRLLIHDHGGGDTAATLAAVGLSFSDLFWEQTPPAERHKQVVRHHRAELEKALSFELTILQMTLSKRLAGRMNSNNKALRHFKPEWSPFPSHTWEREKLAAERIRNGIEALYGH